MGRPATGKNPVVPMRLPRLDWAVFKLLLGRDAHGAIREFIRWYLGRPGARLPKRPTREEVARAQAQAENTPEQAAS